MYLREEGRGGVRLTHVLTRRGEGRGWVRLTLGVHWNNSYMDPFDQISDTHSTPKQMEHSSSLITDNIVLWLY